MSITERAVAARTNGREKKLPKYNAMYKPKGGGWTKIGAAWEVRSGEDALSVQLTAIPIGFDGRFSLFLPNVANDTPTEE